MDNQIKLYTLMADMEYLHQQVACLGYARDKSRSSEIIDGYQAQRDALRIQINSLSEVEACINRNEEQNTQLRILRRYLRDWLDHVLRSVLEPPSSSYLSRFKERVASEYGVDEFHCKVYGKIPSADIYWPMDYNLDTKEMGTLPTLLVTIIEEVTCSFTGVKIAKRLALALEDTGLFVSERFYHDSPTLPSEWVYDEVTSSPLPRTLYSTKETSRLWDRKGYCGSKEHPVSLLRKSKNFYEAHGKWYSFNPSDYPYFAVGTGYVNAEHLQLGPFTYNPTLGVFYKTSGYRCLPYCTNILDYLPEFKTMPYEQYVRGQPLAMNNTLFMGMELEVEMSNYATIPISGAIEQTVGMLDGNAIVVGDGSLTDGYEIVSVPATLDYHRGIWGEFLRSSLRQQIVSYLRESCGIHIHMSKECFSDLSLGKFSTFINSVENRAFIEGIAQRREGYYQSRPPTKVANGKYREWFVDEKGEKHTKYTSVNLLNKHTVEVRIFKGTLAYPQVMKNLEFCHALHKYVTHYSGAARSDLSYLAFCSWLKTDGNRKIYSYLYDYLKKKEYILDKHKLIAPVLKEDVSDSMVEGKVGAEEVAGMPLSKLELIRMSVGHRVRDNEGKGRRICV